MPKQFDNEMRIAFWEQDVKRNSKNPQFRGKFQVHGETFYFAAWDSGTAISGIIETAEEHEQNLSEYKKQKEEESGYKKKQAQYHK